MLYIESVGFTLRVTIRVIPKLKCVFPTPTVTLTTIEVSLNNRSLELHPIFPTFIQGEQLYKCCLKLGQKHGLPLVITELKLIRYRLEDHLFVISHNSLQSPILNESMSYTNYQNWFVYWHVKTWMYREDGESAWKLAWVEQTASRLIMNS